MASTSSRRSTSSNAQAAVLPGTPPATERGARGCPIAGAKALAFAVADLVACKLKRKLTSGT